MTFAPFFFLNQFTQKNSLSLSNITYCTHNVPEAFPTAELTENTRIYGRHSLRAHSCYCARWPQLLKASTAVIAVTVPHFLPLFLLSFRAIWTTPYHLSALGVCWALHHRSTRRHARARKRIWAFWLKNLCLDMGRDGRPGADSRNQNADSTGLWMGWEASLCFNMLRFVFSIPSLIGAFRHGACYWWRVLRFYVLRRGTDHYRCVLSGHKYFVFLITFYCCICFCVVKFILLTCSWEPIMVQRYRFWVKKK